MSRLVIGAAVVLTVLAGVFLVQSGTQAATPVAAPSAVAAGPLRDEIMAARLAAAEQALADEQRVADLQRACVADHLAKPGDLDAALAASDDWASHAGVMREASAQLICAGRCSLSGIRDQGGWMASANRGAGHYFIYCGGAHISNRIYLDAATGRTGR